MDSNTLIASILASIPGLIGLFLFASQRRKNDADASVSITDAAKKLIDPLNKRIDKLEGLVKAQQETIGEQQERISTLEIENEALHQEVAGLRKENQRLVVLVEKYEGPRLPPEV